MQRFDLRLIEPLESEDRRRPYRITMAGAEALAQQSVRMSKVASVALHGSS